MSEQVRVDKWLWAVRLYKTRASANDACSSGRVRINGTPAKPAQRIKVGDVLVSRRSGFSRTYRVVKVIEKRVGAPVAVECYIDETPEEDKPKPRSMDQRIDAAWAERSSGAGRPTKRDRRQMEKFLNSDKKRRR
ncbi:RNA-binding S4 domain-containing protein [Acidimicrobiales bacterium]|jgi:ribosome-associated heat shock protein Hsp15|nr:RNA-binding S4 domain-containing protein [Acidimicrobiaceae bacterium]MCH9804675.1 RNA-binding S4 domain-containing protein [bacterium]MDB2391742.1 RNA-binding S4 domain-containing protein [Acidimicrobiaceae bacterium]MDB9845719.1 RNA-binding S4 domain-containing protein [Acidimicrobiales bacterium]HAY67875.1 RNA-binding protein S4 [Acidimicrobiaceae bacterium]